LNTAADTFDPYRDWLGIAPHEQPADHYRLLGLSRFEADAGRIAAAADERMALVRSFQVGPRRAFTQKLLNELSAARVCLLSAATKAAYDASLYSRGAGVSPAEGCGAGLQPAMYPQSPAAPPIQPPPPPERSVTIDSRHQPATPEEIARPSPWWRPLVSLLAMAIFVLAAAIGWGIYQSTRPPSAVQVPEVSSPPPEPEIEPEPLPQAVVQMQEGSGEVNLAPATAVLQGKIELRPAGTQEVLAGFTSADAAAQWVYRLVLPGFFDLELQYATAPGIENAELTAEVAGQAKLLTLRSTGSLDQFHTDTFTIAVPKNGQHQLLLKPAAPLAGEGLILKSVRLIPVDRGFDGERSVPAGERGASTP
jgi:hypothetical protein